MVLRLGDVTSGRDNNFNLMRFVAAFLVLYDHSFPLSGSSYGKAFHSIGGIGFGHVAVDVFFLTSGFLITASLFRSRGLLDYALSRSLRIFPGLFLSLIVTALMVGPVFTSLGTHEYFANENTVDYVFSNSALLFGLQNRLPGVFESNVYGPDVNGSLWTLPYELKLYAYIAITICLLHLVQEKSGFRILKVGLLACAIVLFAGHVGNEYFSLSDSRSLRLGLFFFAGAAAYVYRDSIILSNGVAAIIGLILAVSLMSEKLFFLSYHIFLPYLVLYVAYALGGRIRGFNRYGDYSYGIYIYAYPVQQSVESLFPGLSIVAYLALSFVVTFMFAYASWNYCEKPALGFKHRLLGRA